MFNKVETWVDLIALEHRILEFWKESRAFDLLRQQNAGKPRWSFLDGPITANNPMGVHHAWGRTLKDAFQRYHAMNGRELRYQNGFDCQGLWVEVEVEKELGFKNKRDIETYGIENFVNRCKERVRKYSATQTQQSIRLGYWMDWDDSYYTMSDGNNYAIWSFLKRCHQRGFIYMGHDSMPWCPRCGTGLSQHEMGEGYKEATHLSVVVEFPLLDHDGESLLVWTTTPWTLSSNVVAAVHPDLDYVYARQLDRVFILAAKLAPKVLKTRGDYQVLRTVKGAELSVWNYRGPFDELPAQELARDQHRVILWDEVSEEDGTGIVHIAPGCGKEDFDLGKREGLEIIRPIDEGGLFNEAFGWLSGRHASEVALEVIRDLKTKRILYSQEKITHSYPHCWRCKTELLFRTVDEWYIAMDGWRQEIIDLVDQIRWIPSYGRDLELDWLRNMHDWMISKKRYWGLALPIWRCAACGGFDAIGSREELKKRAIAGWERFDGHSPHRPWVDEVVIRCGACGGEARRIPDVGNPWLDAGIVPYSTVRYFTDREYWKTWFPADLVLECFPGQFRNWFYSLLAMSAMMEGKPPFKTLLGHALVRDEQGQEMHKSAGNAIWFDEAAEKMGVDVMRWIFTSQDPTINLNFGYGVAKELRGGVFNTLWNTYAFFCNYSRIANWTPVSDRTTVGSRPELDRWIMAELSALIARVRRGFEENDIRSGVRAAEGFIDNLSNWYVRLTRRRFWGDPLTDHESRCAFETLYECLEVLMLTLAPIIPFLTEAIYQNLVRSHRPDAPVSVHLLPFPAVQPELADEGLCEEMEALRRLTTLALAARDNARQKIRQPLAELVIETSDPATRRAAEKFQALLKENLNVKAVRLAEPSTLPVGWTVQPNLKTLGQRFGPALKGLTGAIQTADANALRREMESAKSVRLNHPAGTAELLPDDLKFTLVPPEGFAAATDARSLAAVCTIITEELAREGLMRELLRKLQLLRKDIGLEIEDRIRIRYYTESPRLLDMIQQWGKYLMDELLCLGMTPDDVDSSDVDFKTVAVSGEALRVFIEKA